RLGLRQRRRVGPVASGREPRVRVVDGLGDLLLGQARGEVPDGLVAEPVPVRDRDAVRVVAVVLLPHRAGADASASDRVPSGGHQITWNLVMRPSATMDTNHTS